MSQPPAGRSRTHRPPEATVPPSAGEQAARVAAADRGAFSELYAAHAGRVYRFLLARTSSPAEAEELTSRTFLQALAGLDQYRGRGEFAAWLMGIAHHLLLNWYRARGRRPPTQALEAALEVPSDLPGPEASLEQNEAIARVRAAVSALAPERQRLIALKYVEGRSNAEIGHMMGRTEGAIKALHHRTLKELHTLLGDADRPPERRERTRR